MTEERDHFPPAIAKRLGWYVYRLIDPRNGETFYVGKGRGVEFSSTSGKHSSSKMTRTLLT